MEFLFSKAGSLAGLLGSVAMMFAGYLANQFVIPFLRVGRRQKYASLIATLADEITDELCAAHPKKDWLNYVDTAVDTLIRICEIPDEVARRAVRAALARKKLKH